MKKKLICVLLALVVLGTVNVFAFGIGPQFGGGYGTGGGLGNVGVTFKLDSIPLVFAVDAAFTPTYSAIGATGDYWFLNNNITGPLNWFVGAGAYANVLIAKSAVGFGVGGRVPVGLNMFLMDGFLEPYVQVAPSLGVGIYSSGAGFDWFIPANIGIRFWFK